TKNSRLALATHLSQFRLRAVICDALLESLLIVRYSVMSFQAGLMRTARSSYLARSNRNSSPNMTDAPAGKRQTPSRMQRSEDRPFPAITECRSAWDLLD